MNRTQITVYRLLPDLSRVETVSTLQQYYILTPSHVRESYLFHLLSHPPESIAHLRRTPPEPTRKKSKKSTAKGDKRTGPTPAEPGVIQPPPTIIFCARARSAAYLTCLLQSLGIRSTALHSRLTQRERLNSLSLFRSSVVPVLISTDVGSRGLDIEEVALVVNWDVPSEPEEYTHRVGRTARKGKSGMAVSFVTERDEENVIKIEARISAWWSFFYLSTKILICVFADTKLLEMELSEEQVLEKLNAVSTAKRLANMVRSVSIPQINPFHTPPTTLPHPPLGQPPPRSSCIARYQSTPRLPNSWPHSCCNVIARVTAFHCRHISGANFSFFGCGYPDRNYTILTLENEKRSTESRNRSANPISFCDH